MRWNFSPDTIFQVMTEQPDTCHGCGSRLMLLEITMIDNERVFVCECLDCQRITPVVEDEMSVLANPACINSACLR
jgi:hypothetical protein